LRLLVTRLVTDDLTGFRWIEVHKHPSFHWSWEQLWELRQNHEFWGLRSTSGDIVAFIALLKLPQAWEVTLLATKPEFEGQGFMKNLLQEVLFAKRQEAEIWLEVHEQNHKALKLYQSLGFIQVGIRPRYYSDQKDALLMTLAMAPVPPE